MQYTSGTLLRPNAVKEMEYVWNTFYHKETYGFIDQCEKMYKILQLKLSERYK